MVGGEIFVPKIPSMRVARPGRGHGARTCDQRSIGIRPGEKLHEVMCPTEEARQTLSSSTIIT